MSEIRQLIREARALWLAWSGLMSFINYLQYLSPLLNKYVPTPENAIILCLQIIWYLIVSAVEGLILSLITKPILHIVKMIGWKM